MPLSCLGTASAFNEGAGASWICEEVDAMLLLVKGLGERGLVAHFPDDAGRPLCKTKLKLSDWQIQERVEPPLIVCYHCRRIQSRPSASGQDTV
jgi:hypothetical protein